MHVDLPDDIFNRLRERVALVPGVSEVDVIREALDHLDWQDAERVAIQAGLDALHAGRVRPFEDFDRDFLSCNSIVVDD